MPRASIKDKFFIYAPRRSGERKGQVMLGANHQYDGSAGEITLQDLVDFLKKNNLEPANVPIGFLTVWAKK